MMIIRFCFEKFQKILIIGSFTNISDDKDLTGVDLVLKIDGQAGIDCTDERRRTQLEQPPPHNLAKFANSNFAKLSEEV